MDQLHEELAEKLAAAPAKVLGGPGLAAAQGGARVKLLRRGTAEVLLPLPQLAGGQVPVCYTIRCTPASAAAEVRLRLRDDSNHVVTVRLTGELDQEVQLYWSSIVLFNALPVQKSNPASQDFCSSTACIQSESKQIQQLADRLWPSNGEVRDYAANIQMFVREMKPLKPPRSLDAVGMLGAGANSICTANSNLAVALLRAKGVAARSVAVIPTISQRLEMHRVVEYADADQWLVFDPSGLHSDLPMKPYQSIVMSTTSLDDENRAMRPRMGSMLGCPYGQEVELLTSGVTLWGQDFFWTIAKPLAEFQPDEESIALASEAWKRYMETGSPSRAQVEAAAATTASEFLQSLRSE
jgi:hypothetical protein